MTIAEMFKRKTERRNLEQITLDLRRKDQTINNSIELEPFSLDNSTNLRAIQNDCVERMVANENDSTLKTILANAISSSFQDAAEKNSSKNSSSLIAASSNQQISSISTPLPRSSSSSSSALTSTAYDCSDNRSIYRGLYPINEVKQYFTKTIVDGKKLYSCLWQGCSFKTWKYSQHISRHIYLKHIGIKKLMCDFEGCGKMFKRPESLVQHIKNHSCGFGIDSQIMKDPDNVCGVRNIKRYFIRTLDNDIYVFQCKYGDCRFHTHNSGSIRRHVHNQHVCPFSSPSGGGNQNVSKLSSTINTDSAYDSECDMSAANIHVEVELNEFDGQMYDPIRNQIRNIPSTNTQHQTDLTSGMDYASDENNGDYDEDEDEDDDDNQSINGQNKILEHLQKSSNQMNESMMMLDSDEDHNELVVDANQREFKSSSNISIDCEGFENSKNNCDKVIGSIHSRREIQNEQILAPNSTTSISSDQQNLIANQMLWTRMLYDRATLDQFSAFASHCQQLQAQMVMEQQTKQQQLFGRQTILEEGSSFGERYARNEIGIRSFKSFDQKGINKNMIQILTSILTVFIERFRWHKRILYNRTSQSKSFQYRKRCSQSSKQSICPFYSSKLKYLD